MTNGIDVCEAEGKIDWAGAYAEGVEFAFVRASCGMQADARFVENVLGAHKAGIAVGVYHDLLSDGEREAQFFLSLLRPLREKISLWAICRAEDSTALAAERFLTAVSDRGYPVMLAAPREWIESEVKLRRYPLWLLYWGTTEARALSYNPTVWQYGAGTLAGTPRVRVNRGYW